MPQLPLICKPDQVICVCVFSYWYVETHLLSRADRSVVRPSPLTKHGKAASLILSLRGKQDVTHIKHNLHQTHAGKSQGCWHRCFPKCGKMHMQHLSFLLEVWNLSNPKVTITKELQQQRQHCMKFAHSLLNRTCNVISAPQTMVCWKYHAKQTLGKDAQKVPQFHWIFK